jgi:hypothetical protein
MLLIRTSGIARFPNEKALSIFEVVTSDGIPQDLQSGSFDSYFDTDGDQRM